MDKVEKLKYLREEYLTKHNQHNKDVTEQAIRSGYLDKLLEILGWNRSDPSEVIQERRLQGSAKNKLNTIGSSHDKPDYQLLQDGVKRLYLDAKSNSVDFPNSEEIAFQIRSYGWSSELPYSVVSNFEMFGVYLTDFEPDFDMSTDYKVIYFTIDQLIEEFDVYGGFIDKGRVYAGDWKKSLKALNYQFNESNARGLDVSFLDLVEDTRLEIGKSILRQNSGIGIEKLNVIVQLILNRMLFVRILEDNQIEPRDSLRNLTQKSGGFWDNFNSFSNSRYAESYDGALFHEKINNIKISDSAFNGFLSKVYGKTPYKFDVIKPSLIAEIYELYLAKQLEIDGSTLSLQKKVLNANGAVSTPFNLAWAIASETLQLDDVKNIDDLLKLRVIDPSSGSGTFIIAAFDLIVQRYAELRNRTVADLKFEELQLILSNTLFAVDFDVLALEVLKMSVSIKLLLNEYKKPQFFHLALAKFANNFKLGNTILTEKVTETDVPFDELKDLAPVDYIELFPEIMREGGFSHIISNPPYVEPKHFIKKWPKTFDFLKTQYHSSKGKVDLSLFFIERYFTLMNDSGRVGFVTQKRFFRTQYGSSLRTWLASNGLLNNIVDIVDNNIFKGKTTYVAVIIGSNKITAGVEYQNASGFISGGPLPLNHLWKNISKKVWVSNEELSQTEWSELNFYAISIFNRIHDYNVTFETINESSRYAVKVGPQVLDKKYYFLSKVTEHDDSVTGISRAGEEVTVEKGLTQKTVDNDNMTQFMNLEHINKRILFPYNLDGSLIPIDELREEYPVGYQYLSAVNELSEVAKRDGDEWYGYTRVQNLKDGVLPKIFIPMTALKVVATVFGGNGVLFSDNSNVNAIVDKQNDVYSLKSIAVLMNSESFNLLATAIALPAANGYHKYNKQFIGNVPLPKLNEEQEQYAASLYDDAANYVDQIENGWGDKRDFYRAKLLQVTAKINDFAASFYRLSDDEIAALKNLNEEDDVNESE